MRSHKGCSYLVIDLGGEPPSTSPGYACMPTSFMAIAMPARHGRLSERGTGLERPSFSSFLSSNN